MGTGFSSPSRGGAIRGCAVGSARLRSAFRLSFFAQTADEGATGRIAGEDGWKNKFAGGMRHVLPDPDKSFTCSVR